MIRPSRKPTDPDAGGGAVDSFLRVHAVNVYVRDLERSIRFFPGQPEFQIDLKVAAFLRNTRDLVRLFIKVQTQVFKPFKLRQLDVLPLQLAQVKPVLVGLADRRI